MTLTPNLLSFCELTLFSSCVGRSFTSTNCFSCHLYFLLGLLHVSVEPTINSGFIFFFSSELKLTKVIGFLLC